MVPVRTSAPGNWFDVLVNGFAVIAGIVMCALTVMICADVASRYTGAFAIPWSLEVAEYSLLVVTFLGAPWVLATRGHISIDIVVDRLTGRSRRAVRMISYALGAAVSGVLLVYSVGAWWQSYSQGTLVHQTLIFPEWLFYAVPPPVFLMLSVIFLRWLRMPPGSAEPSSSSEAF